MDIASQSPTPAVAESAALGAAFLARMALGLESSLDDAVRWARWSAPVEPHAGRAAAAGERYQRWCAGLPTEAVEPGATGATSPAA